MAVPSSSVMLLTSCGETSSKTSSEIQAANVNGAHDQQTGPVLSTFSSVTCKIWRVGDQLLAEIFLGEIQLVQISGFGVQCSVQISP